MTGVGTSRGGTTPTGLGQRTGIAQPNISAYESGRRVPTVRTLVALLDACDVELSWRARPARTRSAGALRQRAQRKHREERFPNLAATVLSSLG